jgi:hypothetical protein
MQMLNAGGKEYKSYRTGNENWSEIQRGIDTVLLATLRCLSFLPVA